YTKTNNVTVANPASLTFPAPAIRDVDLNTQACVIGAGITGTRYVPTSFAVTVTNARTGCSATLPNALIYNPVDTTCRSLPVITAPAVLPAASICAPYSQQITAAGGTGVPPGSYTFTASGLPSGLTISASGLISGTPTLSASGPGTPSVAIPVTITVTDPNAQSGTRTYSLILNDPGAPLSVSGNANQTINVGTTSNVPADTISATGGTGTINWTSVSAPVPATGAITVTPTTGAGTNISVSALVPPGVYTVSVTATDTPTCGTFKHTATIPVTVTVIP
ncbi:MAG: putative Ig domain-containing protein, partial [Thermoanaerobaculia bacterium]